MPNTPAIAHGQCLCGATTFEFDLLKRWEVFGDNLPRMKGLGA